jgi:hypothetical protein
MAATVLDVCKPHPPHRTTVTITYYIKCFLKVSCSFSSPYYSAYRYLVLFAAVVIENHGHAALAGIRERLQKNYMPTILLIDLDTCPHANQLLHPSISLLQDVVKELKAGTLHDVAPVGKINTIFFSAFTPPPKK